MPRVVTNLSRVVRRIPRIWLLPLALFVVIVVLLLIAAGAPAPVFLYPIR